VEIPAAIKMINGIVDLRVGQMGQEPKEDSSIAARLKKAHSEINKLKRKLKIPIFLD
jgi:hypothetical protein